MHSRLTKEDKEHSRKEKGAGRAFHNKRKASKSGTSSHKKRRARMKHTSETLFKAIEHYTRTHTVRSRARTLPRREISREVKRYPETPEVLQRIDEIRPHSRKDCKNGVRPCPFVSCKHNLYLDINPLTGSIKFNFPGKELWELKESCALDVAEQGGITLEELGELMNLTRERVRQLESSGMKKITEQMRKENVTDEV